MIGVSIFFLPVGGLGSVVYHREGMSNCVYCMCVCVTCLWERERSRAGRGRGAGGFNSREADGAEGRRLMQQRAREREKEKRRFGTDWMKEEKGKGRDHFTGVGRRCFSEHRKNAGCVCDPPAAAHTEAFRHLWIKAKMVDKFLLSTRGKKNLSGILESYFCWIFCNVALLRLVSKKQKPDGNIDLCHSQMLTDWDKPLRVDWIWVYSSYSRHCFTFWNSDEVAFTEYKPYYRN